MNKSIKASLLSALVFPGLGQLYLKRTGLGLTLLGISLATMIYIISAAVKTIITMSEKIQLREMAIDADTMAELALHPVSGADASLLVFASGAFTVCWVISLIDALKFKQTDGEQ